MAASVNEQLVLGVGHRKLPDVKGRENHSVRWLLEIVITLVVPHRILPAGNLDQRREQIITVRPITKFKTRVTDDSQSPSTLDCLPNRQFASFTDAVSELGSAVAPEP